jgi:hypothetical protein
MEPAAQAA